jgi:two-component system copper resistance phosphate regulon response regulator CusR
LIILDLMLPKLTGMDVLRRIRAKHPQVPVLILTAKSDTRDKVAGLDAGADDYLAKPFAYAELSARARALLRRASKEDVKLRVADLEMDTATRTVKRGGQRVELKPKEYALLEFLLRNVHSPVTRTMIIEHVWDIQFDGLSLVDWIVREHGGQVRVESRPGQGSIFRITLPLADRNPETASV